MARRRSLSDMAPAGCKLWRGARGGNEHAFAGRRTALLFDDFVGAGEQSGRDGDAERLGSFKIDNEFEFFRLLDW